MKAWAFKNIQGASRSNYQLTEEHSKLHYGNIIISRNQTVGQSTRQMTQFLQQINFKELF